MEYGFCICDKYIKYSVCLQKQDIEMENMFLSMCNRKLLQDKLFVWES